jgi:hypothetical protein
VTTQSENDQPLDKHFSRYLRNFFTARMFFSHFGLYFATVIIGIARYGHDVPSELTVLMAIWSIGLLLHGMKTRQSERGKASNVSSLRNDTLNVAFISSLVSAASWVMWTLATDGADASPWHLSAMFTILTGLIIVGLFSKQALFEHWSRQYRPGPEIIEESKRKRGDLTEVSFRLSDDGEIDFTDDRDTVPIGLEKTRKS